MASSYNDSVLDFDLTLFQQNASNTMVQNPEKKRMSISTLKKKVVGTDTLILRYHEKKELFEHTEKLLIASTDECKQICLELKNKSQKCENSEKENKKLRENIEDLQAKCVQGENSLAASQSFTKQLQLLLKERDATIETLKRNKTDENNHKKNEKQICLLKKENDSLISIISSIADAVFYQKKLSAKQKSLLKKYSKISKQEAPLTDEDNSESEVDLFDNNPFSPRSSNFDEQNNGKIHLSDERENIQDPILKRSDHDLDIRSEAVSLDTGRGSSLAFSDSDKCFNSPDHYISNSPLSYENFRNKTKNVDSATSPITVKELVEVATSPVIFYTQEEHKTKTCGSIFDEPSVPEFFVDKAVSPFQLEPIPIVSFGEETSHKQVNLSEKSFNEIETIVQEKQCLELNNSDNLTGINKNNQEIEMILNEMKLNHVPVTPIPPTPFKSVEDQSTRDSENSKEKDVLLNEMKSMHSDQLKQLSQIEGLLKNICNTICVSNLNQEILLIPNNSSPSGEDMAYNEDYFEQPNNSPVQNIEYDIVEEIVTDHNTNPHQKFGLVYENELESHNNNLEEPNNKKLDLKRVEEKTQDVSKRNTKMPKCKKLSRLEKLKQSMLIKNNKIKKADKPPSRKLRKRFSNTRPCYVNSSKPECITSLYNKNAYEKAVKVMLELKSKQKMCSSSISKTNNNRKSREDPAENDIHERVESAVSVLHKDNKIDLLLRAQRNSREGHNACNGDNLTNEKDIQSNVRFRRETSPKKNQIRSKRNSGEGHNECNDKSLANENEIYVSVGIQSNSGETSPTKRYPHRSTRNSGEGRNDCAGENLNKDNKIHDGIVGVENKLDGRTSPKKSHPMRNTRNSSEARNECNDKSLTNENKLEDSVGIQSNSGETSPKKRYPLRSTRNSGEGRYYCAGENLNKDNKIHDGIVGAENKLDGGTSKKSHPMRNTRNSSEARNECNDKSLTNENKLEDSVGIQSNSGETSPKKRYPLRSTRNSGEGRNDCAGENLNKVNKMHDGIVGVENKLDGGTSSVRSGPARSTRNSREERNDCHGENLNEDNEILENIKLVRTESINKFHKVTSPKKSNREGRKNCDDDMNIKDENDVDVESNNKLSREASSKNSNAVRNARKSREGCYDACLELQENRIQCKGQNKNDLFTVSNRKRASFLFDKDAFVLLKRSECDEKLKCLGISIDTISEAKETDITLDKHKKYLRRPSADKFDVPSTRILRSSVQQKSLVINTMNNIKENKTKENNNTTQNCHEEVMSPPVKPANRNDLEGDDHACKLVSYTDLNMFSDEPIPKKKRISSETNTSSNNTCSILNPQDSILCKMIDKYGIGTIKSTPKKIPETVVNSACKMLEDGISHVTRLPQIDSKQSMDVLVEEIQTWKCKEFLAALMKYLMDPVRKIEMFNKVNTPPAPAMTKSEQVLLYIVTRLNGWWPNIDIIDEILNHIEYCLFKLNNTPEFDVVESMSHFYAILCRYIRAKSRLRLFVLDAMYCIQYKAVPLVKQCIDVWMHILPLAHMGTAKTPLVTCLVYLLHFYKCEDKFNRVQDIRNILNKKYFFQVTEWNESKILEIFRAAIREQTDSTHERKMLKLALIILAKRQGAKWCQSRIITNMILPMIAKEDVSEKNKAFCIGMIGPLLKPYPVDMKVHCEILMNQLIDMLDHNPAPVMAEAIITSLICMNKHNQKRVIQALLLWRPQQLSPETEKVIKDYVKEKPVKVWKTILSKFPLER